MGEDQPEDQDPECPFCKGAGWLVLLVTRRPCPDCGGTGRLDGRFGGDDDLEFDDDHTTPPRGTKV